MNWLAGQNSEDMLQGNISFILQYLQKVKVASRAELSKALALTPASISKTVASLLAAGTLVETGYIAGEKGRRSVGLSLANEEYQVIGVKLSRRNYAVGVFDFAGKCYAKHEESFSFRQPLEQVLTSIDKQILQYLADYPKVSAIGMAVPGPFLKESGKILLVTEMEHWREISIYQQLSNSYPVPLTVRHDANSGVLAEWWFGTKAEQTPDTLIHFLVGEGVGAGVLMNGRVLEGDLGIAGEIGHISIDYQGRPCTCGNRGCLERYCSSLVFVEDTKAKLACAGESRLQGTENLTAAMIFQAAQLGDSFAIEQVKEVGRFIGYGVVNLINAYNPSLIIISNEMAGGGKLLLDEISAVVQARVPEEIARHVSVELSLFSEDPVLLGAAAVAIDYCLHHPQRLLPAE